MADPKQIAKRPLSPHLQVYRLPYNALMSISGRGAGIVLSLTFAVLCGWFIAVVWSPEVFDQTKVFAEHPLVPYAFMAWALLVFFYLGNGVRHVLWHIGIGVNEKSGIMTGNIVLVVSILATIGLWQVTCGCWSGEVKSNVVAEGGE